MRVGLLLLILGAVFLQVESKQSIYSIVVTSHGNVLPWSSSRLDTYVLSTQSFVKGPVIHALGLEWTYSELVTNGSELLALTDGTNYLKLARKGAFGYDFKTVDDGNYFNLKHLSGTTYTALCGQCNHAMVLIDTSKSKGNGLIQGIIPPFPSNEYGVKVDAYVVSDNKLFVALTNGDGFQQRLLTYDYPDIKLEHNVTTSFHLESLAIGANNTLFSFSGNVSGPVNPVTGRFTPTVMTGFRFPGAPISYNSTAYYMVAEVQDTSLKLVFMDKQTLGVKEILKWNVPGGSNNNFALGPAFVHT